MSQKRGNPAGRDDGLPEGPVLIKDADDEAEVGSALRSPAVQG